MHKIAGLVFDGKSPKKQEVTLIVDDNGKAAVSSKPNKRFHFSRLLVSPRNGDATRYVTLPNGWLFETGHNDEIDTLVSQFGSKKASMMNREPWLTRLAVLSVALLLSWGLVHFGVPGLARHVAFMVSTETLVGMGQDAFTKMDERHFQPSKTDSSRQENIQEIFKQLLPAEPTGFEYKLHIRHAPEIGANAFALSSGDIIVTDDLIKLAENDEQLSGILLHEIGHVEMRHGIQGTAQTSILALVVIAVSGDVNSAGTLLAAIPALLLNAGYSRNMEWEADGYSLEQMKKRNLDTLALAEMLQRITGDSKNSHSQYWSTHPHTDKRIERIMSTVTKQPEPAI